MKVEAKLIDVWAVYQGGDDRSYGTPSEFYSTEAAANIAAVGRGWYGGNAPVKKFAAIMIEKECYILYKKNPVDLDLNQAKEQERVKRQALNKLSPEEIAALGLKP